MTYYTTFIIYRAETINVNGNNFYEVNLTGQEFGRTPLIVRRTVKFNLIYMARKKEQRTHTIILKIDNL